MVLIVSLVVAGAFAFGLFVLLGPRIGGRFWFGQYGVDQMGEPRRVLYKDHHGMLVDARTHEQMRAESAHLRKSRLTELVTALIVLAGSAGALAYLYSHPFPLFYAYARHATYLWGVLMTGALWVFAGIFFVVGLIYTIKESVMETLYLRGFQHMKGAQVIVPLPRPPPGPEKVYEQKTYGGDAFPSDDELDAALGRRRH